MSVFASRSVRGAVVARPRRYIHRLRGYHGLGEQSYYHTPNRRDELRQAKRNGPGWTREWRAGFTDDVAGEVI